MSPRNYLKHFVLLTALSLGGVAAGPRGALADDAEQESAQLIVVHGTAEVSVRPDSLRVDVGVEVRATTLDQAREQAAHAAQQVVDAIRATAIPNLTLQTKVLQVNPVYGPHRNDQPPAIVGFAASNHVSVTVRQAPLDALGDQGAHLIDAAVHAGANSVGGLEFFLADPSTVQDQALSAAVLDAQHEAEVIAGAAHVTLAGLRSVETSPGGRVVPRSVALEAGVSTPVEVGQILVQSDVTAKFAFQ